MPIGLAWSARRDKYRSSVARFDVAQPMTASPAANFTLRDGAYKARVIRELALALLSGAAAFPGDPLAVPLAQTVTGTLKAAHGRQCLGCGLKLGSIDEVAAIVVLLPEGGRGTALGNCVCKACAATKSDGILVQALADEMVKRFPGAARVFPPGVITHDRPGRA